MSYVTLKVFNKHFDFNPETTEVSQISDSDDNIKESEKINGDSCSVLFQPLPTKINSCLINLTNKCNLSCKYCIMQIDYLADNYGISNDVMSVEDLHKTVDFLYQNGHPKTSIVFYGGEPLLKFDLIRECMRYTKRYKDWFHFSIITNGTLVTEEHLEFIQENKISLFLSLDGKPEVNDSLRVFPNNQQHVSKKVESIIQLLNTKFKRIQFKVNATVFMGSEKIYDTFKYYNSFGIKTIRFERGILNKDNPLLLQDEADINNLKEEFSRIAKDYVSLLVSGKEISIDNFDNYLKMLTNPYKRRDYCYLGKDYINVSPRGDIYPCHKLSGLDEYKIGSVSEGVEYTEKKGGFNSKPDCNDCWAALLCNGFCRCDNFHTSGSFTESVKENCEIQKHLITLSIWIQNELEEKNPKILFQKTGWVNKFNHCKIRAKGKYLHLLSQNANSTGKFLLNLLTEPIFFETLTKKFAGEYQLDIQHANEESSFFLHKLLNEKALEVV